MSSPPELMPAEGVRYVLDALEGAGIEVWVEGGWGVDALLGKETRQHRDLDVAVPVEDTNRAREVLEREGFRVTLDWLPTRFEMTDARGRVVDLHPIRFDPAGDAFLELLDGTLLRIEARFLTGMGKVNGRRLRCWTVEGQVFAHSGYEPTEVDRRDMLALQARFGLDLPVGYD